MKKYLFLLTIFLYGFSFSQNFSISDDEKTKLDAVKNILQRQYSNNEVQTRLLIKKVENIKSQISDEKKLYMINQILDELYVIENANAENYTGDVLTGSENTGYDFWSDSSLYKFVGNGYKINSSYVPSDLKIVPNNEYLGTTKSNLKIREILLQNLGGFAEDFYKAFGKKLFINSGYRSHDEQLALTKNPAYKNLATKADQSEHQLGLAIDISVGGNQKVIERLSGNAYKYGFTQSYPTADSDTKLPAEPWHYRFVGTELAKYLYDNHLSFKEYFFANKDKSGNQ